ncbi:carbohydrate-binding domain-containing protein [Roseicella frigidaeris]|uniref:Glycoside hydrolase family 5 domain-containing protein n=1 Tax=Roseicella frigidaeris TaxID=2230885 RepID=A0A327MAT3_9PROT|nr:carbohydrate-binding domain-containing protein [Roseicella frigidaeris]RAI59627.1 hypothetical protein DOO78_08530 [Roseicella frigidaeris]
MATTLGSLGFATPLGELSTLSDDQLAAKLADYKATGATWLRTDFWWDLVKPTASGGYDWSTVDRVVAAANAQGLKVIGELLGLPSWVQNGGGVAANVSAYGDFAKAAAQHFGDQVNYWEIWNEQNLSGFWGGQPDAAAYTQILKAAYTAIKSVDGNDFVISGGLSPAPDSGSGWQSAVSFLQQMYANGAEAYFDALGFHPYSWPLMPNDTASWNGFQIMQSGIRSLMVANGDADKQIWMTEFGAPTDGGSGAVSEADQATMLQQAITFQQNTSWAGPLLYYSYQDRGSGSWSGYSTESFFGLVHTDGSHKAAYDVFKNGAVPASSGGSGSTGTAVTATLGSGSDALVLRISQDAYLGSAQYTIAVDGVAIGGTQTAGALSGKGDDLITVKGNWGAGNHTLTVTFLNDAWGGTSTTDRNLHVDSISFNGATLSGGTATLGSNGPVNFAFVKSASSTNDTAPAMQFGTPGSWGQDSKVSESHLTYGSQDYHAFRATAAWGAVDTVKSAPASWAATNNTHLAVDNFKQVQLDLRAAGSTGLDVMAVAAKGGAITTGNGNDLITWVAHSDASGTGNTMLITTGAGNDTVRITAASLSTLDQYDVSNNGSLFNASYNGKYSTADVYTGAGTDIVTTEGSVRLVLHAGAGPVTATGGAASDTFFLGKGTADLTGGLGNDLYVITQGSGHAVIEDFATGADKLRFTGITSGSVTSKVATENGVSGLKVTYDSAGDSVFLAHVTKLAAADMVFA